VAGALFIVEVRVVEVAVEGVEEVGDGRDTIEVDDEGGCRA
jgi:hypothetical protein